MALGFLILGTQVILPLVSFKTQNEPYKSADNTVLGAAIGFRKFEFRELHENEKETATIDSTPEYFYLTIPKLNIENAVIETNSTNLSPEDTLGHYKGSNLPGEPGNTFIYGHSVLPWFYNPKNYKTIFSTLDQLETGDEFTISYKNKQLKYKVEGKEVLYPTSVDPLANWKPSYLNDSTATLMTCWPAGTKTKRLIIKATLVN